MPENNSKINKENVNELPGNLTPMEASVADSLIRNLYVRERHFFIHRLLFLSMFINVFMLGVFTYEFFQPVQNVYFATDTDGRIVKLKALTDPVQGDTEVGDWATAQLVKSFTFDYVNYRSSLSSVQGSFTSNGWLVFQNSLKQAKILESVIANKYVANATPNSAPVLLAEGVVEGHYAWKFQIPITVNFEGGSGSFSQSFNLTVLVIRQPETEHPNGLAIAQLVSSS